MESTELIQESKELTDFLTILENEPDKIRFGDKVIEEIQNGLVEILYTTLSHLDFDTSSVKKIVNVSCRTKESHIFKNFEIAGILYYNVCDDIFDTKEEN